MSRYSPSEHYNTVKKVSPLTDSLGLLHGVSCSQNVLGVKGHNGLHLQDGGIGQGMVHAIFYSVKKYTHVCS